ncbi:glycoside hydrolase family 15 protein [archaeon]|nr:glycoside hydrolase family 15 protein [archaeon]
MTRPVVLGNGNILVCMDENAAIRDFYYPYVGEENHVQGNTHYTGFWVDNKFSWLSRDEWSITMEYEKETLVSSIKAVNEDLKLEVTLNDAVYHGKNIFLRRIRVRNLAEVEREVRVFLHQHFHISEDFIGNTVYYDPKACSMIHYKGKRYFLMNGLAAGGKSFNDYATGLSDEEYYKGTYLDALDGNLSKNPIEHGSVDSVIGFSLNVKPGYSKTLYYWITVGKKYGEVSKLNKFVLNRHPNKLIKETGSFWKKWVNRHNFNFKSLSREVVDLFKRSLLIIRTQTDDGGAIIAANDSDTLQFSKDTYSYMWPRDGALVARALDRAGYKDMTLKFFEFCNKVLSSDGYLLPKYKPDTSVGTSWHSWVRDGGIQLPIQEDETALVLDALWKKYDKYKNKSLINKLYKPFIKQAADFMEGFRDEKTGLPKESYDLWEEKLGVHTFTCSTVYAGLKAAANFAKIFGTKTDSKKYDKAAEEIKKGVLKHLYDEEEGFFIKRLYLKDDDYRKDKTIDASSGYGVFEYRVLDVNDERVANTMKAVTDKLCCDTNKMKGLARYQDDDYHQVSDSTPGNPWFVTTLWLAEYYITKAESLKDLEPAVNILEWVVDYSLSTGVLSEQINPFTGEPLSVAPLTWSHAGFVIAVVKYLDKRAELSKKRQ